MIFFGLALLAAGPKISLAREPERGFDFGSGSFGRWALSDNGLPAYLYTLRLSDPRAVWDPKVFPKTNLQWHQLGNLRVNANAYNLGVIKLFYGESNAMWLNEFEPDQGEHSGGFGWLIDGDTVLVDRDDCVPAGGRWEREFGAGYFRKRLAVPGLELERRVFAPAGDDPYLVSELALKNSGDRERKLALIEYWDVNVNLLAQFLITGQAGKRLQDKNVRVIASPDRSLIYFQPARLFGPHGGFPKSPALVDPELPEIFLAALDSAPAAWITDCRELFVNGRPRLDSPKSLASLKEVLPTKIDRLNQACLAARKEIVLAPHSATTVRYIYGYAKGQDPEELVKRARDNADQLWPRTAADWKENSPTLTLPRDAFLARELVWDYYYFTSAALYSGYYQKHHVPQGANYLYTSGGNGATRDYAAFVQTLTYYRPELAREILEFMTRAQDPGGRLFYDLEGYGIRYRVPYRPGDLDLWFLMALSEYVLAARDFAFLDQVEPYYPMHEGKSGTVWEHAQKSFDHLVNQVGVGPRGHPRLRLSDWNDEMLFLTAGSNPLDMIATFSRGESVMNTAMACYIMPNFRELARIKGDITTAQAVQKYLDRMRTALRSAWQKDHLIRAYSGFGRPYGDTDMYLEPQVFALLAPGALEPEREKILVAAINEKLRQPSTIGMMISTSTSGSLTTRPGEQEEGGVWFAINGPGVVALSRFDRGMAWDELIKNTLAWHASVYPQNWSGIWSGPDAWNSVFSDRPSETWYMKTPVMNTGPQMYPVQNAHSHCQTMYAIARLAGVTPTPEGWTIAPKIPLPTYSFTCALYSIEVSPSRIAGEVKLPVVVRPRGSRRAAELKLQVQLPEAWRTSELSALVNNQKTEVSVQDNRAIIFITSPGPGQSVSWEIAVARK